MTIKIEIDILKFTSTLLSYLQNFLKKFNITHLLLIVFALHLFVMSFPSDGGMVFDEVHYIKATRAHFEGIGANPEHTPLVKVLMTIPIAIFNMSSIQLIPMPINVPMNLKINSLIIKTLPLFSIFPESFYLE